MLRFVRVAGLALGTVPLAVVQALAGEYQCQRDDAALRIAIEVKKEGHTLPCDVVIEEDRNERSVLYSAQYDRNYCPERLEKTRAELEGDGWLCQQSSTANIVAGTGKIQPLKELALSQGAPPATTSATAITDSRSCEFNGDLRRLRIEVEDPRQGKPCSLIYWSEADQSEAGQLLWRAEHDADFCTKRLGFIVEKWADEGWQCTIDDGIIQSAARSAASIDEQAEEQVETQTQEPTQAQVNEDTEEQVIEQVAALNSSTSEGGEGQETPIETAEQLSPVDPQLQAIIEADAIRIGEWMEVEADIEVVAYGDLNEDGRDDAVVFLAYQSDQAAYRQYLMSYLNADETYELAGVKLLTGVKPPPAEAKVEGIDGGVIWLSLVDTNGTRLDPVGYRLRDQQLLQVEAPPQSEAASN